MATIIGISGSPRKAATEYALQQALRAAGEVPGVETKLLTLRGKQIGFCIHCDRCVREETRHCLVHRDDDMQPLFEQFLEADGYIVASPVYMMNPTAQLTAFFNRFRAAHTLLTENTDFFRFRVGGAMAVGGTRNGGQELTINAIHGFYHTLGITVINGGLGVYAGVSVWSRDQRAAGAEADVTGMENAGKLGRRVAEAAVALSYRQEPG